MFGIIKRFATALLLICLESVVSFAQEKNLAYYNDHETEIIGDAQKAFLDGNYERVLKLCDWHYLIVGDGRADKLKQKAKSCLELYQSMVELSTSGQSSAAREKAQALLAINPNDQKARKIYSIVQVGPSMGSETGHTWVDLGLSVKWATCNVGSITPADYGDYFAWGETKTKSYYNWITYKYCKYGNNSLTKYNISSSYGEVDRKKELALEDDAARANWGGGWRIPTDAEWTELRENCTCVWTTRNGVFGIKVTSIKPGYTDRSIFLPAAGYRNEGLLVDAGVSGGYWSSSVNPNAPFSAYSMDFYENSVGRDYYSRNGGFSVRPVIK